MQKNFKVSAQKAVVAPLDWTHFPFRLASGRLEIFNFFFQSSVRAFAVSNLA